MIQIFLSTILLSTLFFSKKTYSKEVQNILHIGDSQTHGYFGHELFHYLKEHFDKDNLRIVGIGGSSPRHWVANRLSNIDQWPCNAKGRYNANSATFLRPYLCHSDRSHSFFQNLGLREQELVIFQFLGNSMGQSQKKIQESIDLLLGSLKGRSCFFITSPPFYKSLASKNIERRRTEGKLILSLKSRCSFFRGMDGKHSKSFSNKRDYYKKDLIHLSAKGAKAFLSQLRPILNSLVSK